MSVSFLAAGVATAVAAVITAILVGRFARLPRPDQAAWACAAAGLTVALAAQALGYHWGFNAAAFRAIEVGARLAAPMALVWGLAELTGKSFGVRFGSRLGLAALTAIAGVVLASDPLSGVTFTVAWPTAADHYQFIPNVVLVVIAAATVIPALAALAVAAVRARREPGWREVFPAVAAGAAAALLTLGLQVKLPVNSGYAAICLIAAALTWFAGDRSRRVRLADLHEIPPAGDDTGWSEAYTDTGYGRYGPDSSAMRRVGSDTGFGLYRPETGGFGRVGSDTDFGGLYRPEDTGGIRDVSSDSAFRDIGSDTGYGFYRTDTDLRPIVTNGADHAHSEPVPGIIETGDILPVSFDVFTPPGGGVRPARPGRGREGEGAGTRHARLHRAWRAVRAHAADPLRGVPRRDGVHRARPAALHPGLRRGAQALRAGHERDRARRPAGEALTAGRPAGERSGPARPARANWPAEPTRPATPTKPPG